MLVWRILAMVLVAAGALLSLGPVVALFQQHFGNTREGNRLVALLRPVIIFLPATLVLHRISYLSQANWLTQYGPWKLALEGIAFPAVLTGWVLGMHGRTRFRYYFFKGPYLYLIYAPLLGLEIYHYAGTLYVLGAIFVTFLTLFVLSGWLTREVSRWLRNPSAPLALSVSCICIANAIQLFVLK